MKKFDEKTIKTIGNALYATLFLFAFVLIGQNFVTILVHTERENPNRADGIYTKNPVPIDNTIAQTEVMETNANSQNKQGKVLGTSTTICGAKKDRYGCKPAIYWDTEDYGDMRRPYFIPVTQLPVVSQDGKVRITVTKGGAWDLHNLYIYVNNVEKYSEKNVDSNATFQNPKVINTSLDVKKDDIIDIGFSINKWKSAGPPVKWETSETDFDRLSQAIQFYTDHSSNNDWHTRYSQTFTNAGRIICGGGDSGRGRDVTDLVQNSYSMIGFYCLEDQSGLDWDHDDMMIRLDLIPPIINGSCGTTLNTCNAGTLSDIADSSATDRPNRHLWNCLGLNGGNTANCWIDKAQCDGMNLYNNTDITPNVIPGSSETGKPLKNLSDTITVRIAPSQFVTGTEICWAPDLLGAASYLSGVNWKCRNISEETIIINGTPSISKYVRDTLQGYINQLDSSVRATATANGLVFVTNMKDASSVSNKSGFCSTSPGYTGNSTYFSPGWTGIDGNGITPRTENHICGVSQTSSQKCIRRIGINTATPVAGLCGSADDNPYSYTDTAYTGSFCNAGTADPASPAFPAVGSSTTWTCNGSDGGANVSCTALRNNPPSDGSCGLSHGKYFTSAPATDLCGTGTASGVTTTATGSWAWNCNGSDGGVNVSCTANLLVNVDAFSININYDEPKTIDFLDSKDYTFATNLIPEYIQSGAAYADTSENPNLNMDTNIGENPITITQALCSGNSSCNIGPVNGTNRFGGATTCFTGDANMEKDIALGEPDNPITFWFEYEDKDNYLNPAPICRVNEFNSHKLALVPKGSYTATAIADNGDVLNRSTLYIEYNLSENKLETVATSAKGHDKVTITPIIKYDSQNKLRIAYKLKFGSNFPVGSYDLFSLVTSQINDPRKDYGGTLLYDNPIFPHSGKFNKVGEWTIDTIAPEVRQPYYSELGEDSFNINWGVRSNLELLDLNLGCYSNDLTRLTSAEASVLGYYNPLDFVAAFHSPLPGSFDNTFNTANRPECTPEGNTFLKNRVNTTLNTLQAMKSKHRIADPSEITNFVAKGRAVDKACNNIITSPIGTLPPTSENWISSEGGTFMSDTVSFDPQTSLFSKDHNLYCNYEGQASSNNQLLYSQVNDDILNLSTNSVFSTDNTVAPVERSLISAVAPDYSDTLDNELNRTSNTYFNVIEQKLNNYGLFNDVIIGDVSVDNVTDLFDCPDDKSCYIKIEGNLTINGSNGMDNKFGCTDKNMVLVTGNLTVIHNLTKSDPSMCCAFVVNGDIDFTKPISEAPKDETRFNSASEVDKQNWINTSQYDCGTGFFYSEGGDIIIQNDSTNYGIDVASENYADAFSLFGQLIARNGNIYQNRSNGLRNSLQPPVYIQQDSCIYKNFKAASEVFVNTRDITY